MKIVYLDKDNVVFEHNGFREIIPVKDIENYRETSWYKKLDWITVITWVISLAWCVIWLRLGFMAGDWIGHMVERYIFPLFR